MSRPWGREATGVALLEYEGRTVEAVEMERMIAAIANLTLHVISPLRPDRPVHVLSPLRPDRPVLVVSPLRPDRPVHVVSPLRPDQFVIALARHLRKAGLCRKEHTGRGRRRLREARRARAMGSEAKPPRRTP